MTPALSMAVALSSISAVLLAGAQLHRRRCYWDRPCIWRRICTRALGIRRELLGRQRQLEQ